GGGRTEGHGGQRGGAAGHATGHAEYPAPQAQAGKWVADAAFTLPAPSPTSAHGIMGVDRGVTVPAVVQVTSAEAIVSLATDAPSGPRGASSPPGAKTFTKPRKSAPSARARAKSTAGCLAPTISSPMRSTPRRRAWAASASNDSLASVTEHVSAPHAPAVGPSKPRPAPTPA